MAPDDALILYSDGVVEAHNLQGELYDDARFARLLETTAAGADANRIVRTVVRSVNRFIGNAPRTDDVTVLALKREGTET